MAKAPFVTDEARALIGKVVSTNTYQLSKEDIKKLAISIGDLNPLYMDEEKAKKSRYGGIIAPPLMIFITIMSIVPESELGFDGKSPGIDPPMKFEISVFGGAEMEFFAPVRAGDTITANMKILDIKERESSKGGWLALITREITLTNQKGEVLVVERITNIYR